MIKEQDKVLKPFTKEYVVKQLQASIKEESELAIKLERVRGTIAYLDYVLSNYDLPSEPIVPKE